MQNRNRNYRISATIYLVASIVWAISALLDFIQKDYTFFLIYLALAIICLGVSIFQFRMSKMRY